MVAYGGKCTALEDTGVDAPESLLKVREFCSFGYDKKYVDLAEECDDKEHGKINLYYGAPLVLFVAYDRDVCWKHPQSGKSSGAAPVCSVGAEGKGRRGDACPVSGSASDTSHGGIPGHLQGDIWRVFWEMPMKRCPKKAAGSPRIVSGVGRVPGTVRRGVSKAGNHIGSCRNTVCIVEAVMSGVLSRQ